MNFYSEYFCWKCVDIGKKSHIFTNLLLLVLLSPSVETRLRVKTSQSLTFCAFIQTVLGVLRRESGGVRRSLRLSESRDSRCRLDLCLASFPALLERKWHQPSNIWPASWIFWFKIRTWLLSGGFFFFLLLYPSSLPPPAESGRCEL